MRIPLAHLTIPAALLVMSGLPVSAQTSNSDTARLFYQAFAQNQPDLFDQVLAPDWEDIPLSPGQEPGREAFKPLVSGFHEVFSDLNIVNDDVIEAGDKVVVRSTISGTQAGPFAGFASEGRSFSTMAIDIHQFDDGMIIRTWHIEDWLGALYQLGALD